MEKQVKFAQLSDLHLGARMQGSRLGLSGVKLETRRAEMRQALTDFVETARRSNVQLVLLPGDLFDSPDPTEDDVTFLIDTLNRLHPIPTFIAPGNHDYYSATSCYNTDSVVSRERGSQAPQWGDHIHIFRDSDPRAIRACNGAVSVTGCAFAEHMCDVSELLGKLKCARQAPVNILMVHASVGDAAWAQTREPQVLPMTVAQLADLGYDYAAVGHYHAMHALKQNNRVVGAYAGCAAATGLDEVGAKGFLLGTLRAGEPVMDADLDFQQADRRQVRRLVLDVSSLPHQTAFDLKLHALLLEEGAKPEDMIFLRIVGRHPPGAAFEAPTRTREGYFHFIVVDESEPDYAVDLDAPAPERPALGVEGEFIERMRELWKAAPVADRQRVRDALHYGLDALHGREVKLR